MKVVKKNRLSGAWDMKPVVVNGVTQGISRVTLKMKAAFKAFDRKVDGAISFFFRHYGKTKFMVAMSKRAQVLGLEKLFEKGPKAFVYFFLFYLVRDTILYILIPIGVAYVTN